MSLLLLLLLLLLSPLCDIWDYVVSLTDFHRTESKSMVRERNGSNLHLPNAVSFFADSDEVIYQNGKSAKYI